MMKIVRWLSLCVALVLIYCSYGQLELFSNEMSYEEKAFLEQSAKQEGTIVLTSGLQYRVIKSGITIWELILPSDWIRRKPLEYSHCQCHYTGRTIRGNIFETSDKNGGHVALEVTPTEIIPGLREALLLMQEGDHWEVVIPSALGFGQRTLSHKHLLPEPVLIFDVVLVKVREDIDSLTITERALDLAKRKPLLFFATSALAV